jgi:hypothetical protein
MIHLTSHLHSIPVAVNPALVTHVIESPQGCVVYFGEKSIHVANNYLEVVGAIAGHK